ASASALLDAHGAAEVRIEPKRRIVFVNGSAVKARRTTFVTFDALMRTLVGFGIGEVRFLKPPARAQVVQFLEAVKKLEPGPEACAKLAQALEAAQLASIVEVLSEKQSSARAVERVVEVDELVYVKLAYARTLALLREYYKRMRDEELRR